MPRPHIFADGPGNSASGVQVNENLDYEEGLITAEAASRSAGDAAVLAALSLLIPVGAELGWYGSADPAGGQFMIQDGRAISRTTYAALFALPGFGTTHGVGDGVTTFNIPNHLGRGGLGAGTASPAVPGGTAHTLGVKGGEETHLLTGVESGVNPNGSTNLDNLDGKWGPIAAQIQAGAANTVYANPPYNAAAAFGTLDFAHQHALTDRAADAAHNILNPHIVKNYILRVL